MSKTYSYDDMEKLSQKIQKIKRKKNLEDIRDIILENNKNLKITENSYGIYLCFNQLSSDTYSKLDKYVKKYFEMELTNKKTSSFTIPLSSQNEDDKYSNNDNYIYDGNSRLKFSNKEKNLIKKRLYDKALKLNSEINDYEKNFVVTSESNSSDNYVKNDNLNTEKSTEKSTESSKIFLKKPKKIDKK
jgi:hypothetical protein